MLFSRKKLEMPTEADALPGRETAMRVASRHVVLDTPMTPPFPDGFGQLLFGMGCFWGAEKKFWESPGIYTTAVGYAAGYTPNPTYEEVCSGMTGHNEVVLVVYDPAKTTLGKLLGVFWQNHDPTQGMRQGNDRGTQYRSGIYCSTDGQTAEALESRKHYQEKLSSAGRGQITTEILDMPPFYYAEDYHQQYLAKNPNGYCGLGGTGIPY